MNDSELAALVHSHMGRLDQPMLEYALGLAKAISDAATTDERERCLKVLFQQGAPRSDAYGDWASTAEAIETGLKA